MQVCTSKKNVQSRKSQKPSPNSNNEEDENGSNASQELKGGASSESKGSAILYSNGKTRASRGLPQIPEASTQG